MDRRPVLTAVALAATVMLLISCGKKEDAPAAAAPGAQPAATAPTQQASTDAAKRWVDTEFQPSVLSKDEQLKEMEWFMKAAQPLRGLEVNVLSETIPTHEYESKTLTRAFFEITGIKVNHQLLGEGEVVQAVQTQMQTNRNLYDAYINDSDLMARTRGCSRRSTSPTGWLAKART